MKKNSINLIVLTALMIAISGNFVVPKQILAVETAVTATTTSLPADTTGVQTSTNTADVKSSSDYMLPYPGILPDHPLYFLKDLRDKIIEVLIVDPERKSEFYLLQSDKYISAVQALLDKGQKEKAKTILSQSSDKLIQSVTQLSNKKTSGAQIQAGSIDHIQKSIQKHTEVLQSMSAIDVSDATAALQRASNEVSKLK